MPVIGHSLLVKGRILIGRYGELPTRRSPSREFGILKPHKDKTIRGHSTVTSSLPTGRRLLNCHDERVWWKTMRVQCEGLGATFYSVAERRKGTFWVSRVLLVSEGQHRVCREELVRLCFCVCRLTASPDPRKG